MFNHANDNEMIVLSSAFLTMYFGVNDCVLSGMAGALEITACTKLCRHNLHEAILLHADCKTNERMIVEVLQVRRNVAVDIYLSQRVCLIKTELISRNLLVRIVSIIGMF